MKRYLAILTLALPLFGGGFYLNVKPPSAQPGARAQDAALVASLAGCHQAEKGTLTATAVGVVDGQRQTMPLKVIALPQPGSFAVEAQWPNSGRWVVVLSARHPAFPVPTTTAVPIVGKTPQFNRAKHENRRPLTQAEVDELLK